MPKRQNLPDGMCMRGKVYHADFRAGGRRIRKRLSRNFKTASQLLIELRARAERGEYGLLDNDYPVEELKKQWLQHCRQTLKPGTVQRYEYSLSAILPKLPPRISQVTAKVVMNYREERLGAKTSPRTINMDVATVATMFTWGIDQRLIADNPLQGLKPLPHDNPKEGRSLEEDEVSRLLNVSPALWHDIWYAFLVTGLRKNELACLTFDDIDWEARELVVQRGIAKNHNSRRIPIENGLWKILTAQRDSRDQRQPGRGRRPEVTARVVERFTRDHVFVTTQNTPLTHGSGLYYAFIRCCKLAKIQTKTVDAAGREIDHVDLHSLRRTFATNLIINGADPKTVQELMGHKTLAMTMNLYAKIRVTTKRQALGRLSYGAGVQAPEHVVEFPATPKDGHKMVTKAADAEVS